MLSNIIRTVLIYACRGGRGVACCGTPRRNCPISRFSTRATISIFYNEELHVWQQFLGCEEHWVITVSYIIGIVGAVRLWEAADPKDKKNVSELPCFTLSHSEQIPIGRQEITHTSLPRPHHMTHSLNDAESTSNLALPSWLYATTSSILAYFQK